MSKKIKISLAILLFFLTMIGTFLIDNGASFKCYQECKDAYESQGLSKDFDFVMQSLIFSQLEPRITYHLGILIVIVSLMLLTLLYLFEVMESGSSDGNIRADKENVSRSQ